MGVERAAHGRGTSAGERGTVHTLHRGQLWYVEVEGEGIVSADRSKSNAEAVGRVEAMHRCSTHLIHDFDGAIMARESFGTDAWSARL